MKISGLIKLSALDYPEKIACTVFTHGCPFRCPFCHNAALVTEKEEAGVEEEEFFAFLAKRRGILDGVAVTGGEPLMQLHLADFLRRIKDMGYLVKLDTNGFYPDALQKCIDASLVDYIAMDIKNSPAKYAQSCGVETVDMEKIRRSIEIIKNSGLDYEFRTTAVKELHEDADFLAMGEMINGARKWYIQLFKDSGGLICSGLTAPGAEDMERWKTLAKAYGDIVELRGI